MFHDPYHTNEKRFHNFKHIKKVAEVPADANVEQSHKDGSTMGSSTTIYSVSDLYGFVKRFDKEFTPASDVKHTNERVFHNLKYIEKVTDSIGSLTRKNSAYDAESTNDVSPTTYSVSDLYGFVKRFDKEFTPVTDVKRTNERVSIISNI